MKRFIILLVIVITNIRANAQVNHYYVDPESTGAGIKRTYSGHLVTLPATHKFNGKLFITIPGTNSTAEGLQHIDSVAALAGYHVISLDYPNKRNTATLTGSADKLIFNKFRQELNFGTPVCDSIQIDTLNSIVNRITALVTYLAKNHVDEGWQKFLSGDGLKWRKVVLAGHSQGAGHAAYLAQHYKVHRIIMLSGPQDFLSQFDMPAPWLSSHSKTPAKRYYSLLHTNDMYNTSRQIRNDLTVMHTDSTVINHFNVHPIANNKSRIFVSDASITAADFYDDAKKKTVPLKQTGAVNHSSTIRPIYSAAWLYLLR